MRYYEPARVERILELILSEPSLTGGVRHHAVVPARSADVVPIPAWLDPRIAAGLASRGVHSLYTHQAEAIEAVRAGDDVVVVTPTASGKTRLAVALAKELGGERKIWPSNLTPTSDKL